MKGYYILFSGRKTAGVSKKIDMQIEQLSKLGDIIETDAWLDRKRFFRCVISALPFIDFPWNYSDAYAKIENPDYIYMRRAAVDRPLIKFLGDIKKRYPSCKIICEIPTYPFTSEMMRDYSGILTLAKHWTTKGKLKKYVDRIVTYTQDKEIFGIPTIRTINGINVSSVKPVVPQHHAKNEIHLIAVSTFQRYNGYERLIKGVGEYYRDSIGEKRKICLHMVGDGVEKAKYVKLVNKLHLEDKVIFYGIKNGSDLDELYNRADLAVSVFGLYKYNDNLSSALRIREYLAKGLPIITGCKEDVLTPQFPYYLEYENNNSIISIDKIIEFYDKVYVNNSRIRIIREIRKYAENTVNMEIVMKPIMQYIAIDN